eukprot:scaffold1014_cov274-Chaetoceros_neogracile.AAC.11
MSSNRAVAHLKNDADYSASGKENSNPNLPSPDHSVSSSSPTRRKRKQRSIFQPEDTRDVPIMNSKKKHGRPPLSQQNHGVNSDINIITVARKLSPEEQAAIHQIQEIFPQDNESSRDRGIKKDDPDLSIQKVKLSPEQAAIRQIQEIFP